MIEGPETLRSLPGSDRQIVWVPARRTLKHALFELPEELSGRKKLSALDLKVQAWAPFAETGYSVSWQGNQASVFAWDQTSVEQTIAAHGYDPNRCTIVPEVFVRDPLPDGVRLAEVSDGVEGQAWRNGFVSVTRWWKDLPTGRDWSLFLRSAGLPLSSDPIDVPDVSTPEWLETPWNMAVGSGQILTEFLSNRRLVTGVAIIALAPWAFFASEWVSYSVMLNKLQVQIDEVQIQTQSVREERSRALSLLEYAEDLSSLQQYPHQIEIISRAHSLLAPYEVEISGWDYDGGLLEFGLISESDMDATIYIPVFENDSLFSRVSSSTRGARLLMRMNVVATADLSQ